MAMDDPSRRAVVAMQRNGVMVVVRIAIFVMKWIRKDDIEKLHPATRGTEPSRSREMKAES